MEALTALFISTSQEFELPDGLLSAICYVESTHDASKVHYNDGHSDSYGVCQIKLETAQFMGFEGEAEDLMDPEINMYYAAAYLRHQINRYGNIQKAVIAYNKGKAGTLVTSRYQETVFNVWRSQ